MNLQGRNLSFVDPPLNGADVRMLHEELRAIGLVIPDGELQDGYFGTGTRVAVSKFQEKLNAQLHADGWHGEAGTVEEVTARFINREFDKVHAPAEKLFITGRVVRADGTGVAGVLVKAFDQDLPSKPDPRQLLADPMTTGPDGRYRIAYPEEKYQAGEARSKGAVASGTGESGDQRVGADIVVAAYGADGQPIMRGEGRERRAVESRIHFNAGAEETIEDLVVDAALSAALSEYEQLLADIGPVIDPVAVIDLKPVDIGFLAGETGWDEGRLGFAVRAAQCARQAESKHKALQGDAFYALMRSGLPAEWADLMDKRRSVHESALDTAFGASPPIIAAALAAQKKEWLDRLQALRREALAEEPGAGAGKSLGAWIASTVKFTGATTDDEARRRRDAFLDKLVAHDGDPPAFWNALRNDELLRPDVGKLQLTLQLGILTRNDSAFTQAVLVKHAPAALRDLVALTETDWHAMLEESNAPIPPETDGSTPEVKRRLYAATLVGMLQLALPVETTAHAVARMKPEHFGTEVIRDGVARFLLNASSDELKQRDTVFDLAVSHIDAFIEQHTEVALAGIGENERQKVVDGVKRCQRLYRISTRPETLETLLALPHGSAYEIGRISKKSFVARYGDQLGGDDEAGLIHDRAVAESSTRLALAMQIYQHLNEPVPAFIGGEQ